MENKSFLESWDDQLSWKSDKLKSSFSALNKSKHNINIDFDNDTEWTNAKHIVIWYEDCLTYKHQNYHNKI